MKMMITTRALLLPALLLFYGCATTNLDRAEKTTDAMDLVERDINRISVQLKETEASLDNLLNTKEIEMQAAFEAYQEDVDKIINLKKHLRQHADRMRKAGSTYFTEWEIEGETYANPELRDVSTKRRKELHEKFNQIADNSGKINRELDAYINHIKEVEDYLSKDLSPDALNAVTPTVKNIDVNGKLLKQSISDMQLALSTTRPQMRKLARN
jgi:predicted phage-related endonuclease